MLAWQVTDVLMYNSLKELKYETRPMGTVSVTAIFQQDGKIENKSVSRSFRTGVEMLTDGLLEEMAAEVVHGIDERFAARRPKGGRMPVVMGAGASGILLHEAMGHAFEADFNRKGTWAGASAPRESRSSTTAPSRGTAVPSITTTKASPRRRPTWSRTAS